MVEYDNRRYIRYPVEEEEIVTVYFLDENTKNRTAPRSRAG